MGQATPEQLAIRPEQSYVDNDIEALLGTRVDSIDRTARRLALSNGTSLAYQALALTPGGRPRPLPIMTRHGARDNVHYIRSAPDTERLRSWLHG